MSKKLIPFLETDKRSNQLRYNPGSLTKEAVTKLSQKEILDIIHYAKVRNNHRLSEKLSNYIKNCDKVDDRLTDFRRKNLPRRVPDGF